LALAKEKRWVGLGWLTSYVWLGLLPICLVMNAVYICKKKYEFGVYFT